MNLNFTFQLYPQKVFFETIITTKCSEQVYFSTLFSKIASIIGEWLFCFISISLLNKHIYKT